MIRKLVLFILYIFVPLTVVVVTYGLLSSMLLTPVDPSDTSTVVFQVSEQESFRQVARELEEQNLVKHAWAINLIAQFKRKDKAIMAGEYELSRSLTPDEILDKMVGGKMLLRKVTVREGVSIWEIGPLIQEAGIISRAEFDAALTDPALLKEFSVAGSSFEGYLYPETYQFPKNTQPKKIISTMVAQLNAVWKPAWESRLTELNLSRHQLLTLASIVEKESGSVEEQPTIASVFYNRLAKRMKLQADPTVIYGLANFDGNLKKEDLVMPTPYNTYVIEGLPPGPIANPGIRAIEATLFPAQTNYLYFVADGQGKHIFSETLDNHNSAVDEFQKSPARNGPEPKGRPEKKAAAK